MIEVDPFHPDRVAGELPGRLRTFNDAGVLSSADIHTATRLARLTGCEEPDAILAAAFAVRAPRFGHVFAQLDALADTVTDEDGRVADLDPDVWPDDLEDFLARVAASPMVTVHLPARLDESLNGDSVGISGRSHHAGTDEGPVSVAPLHLDENRLYLDRYWRYEHRVAEHIRKRQGQSESSASATSSAPASPASPDNTGVRLSTAGMAALTTLMGDNEGQQAAAVAALTSLFTVIAGGPGTGKTWVIAQAVSVARRHASRPDGRPLRIAIAAPTGKAAARLGEQLRELDRTEPGPNDTTTAIQPTTLHRLLGWRPNRTRFRHDRTNRLPFDLVILDEVSMVPLSMLSSLLEALEDRTHLVLVGDPDQLAAVEAGTVLGDLVQGAGSAVVTLDRGYRFDDQIKNFSVAVRDGDAAAALACLEVNPDDLADVPLALVVPDRPGEWPDLDPALADIRGLIVADSSAMVEHAANGHAPAALEAALRVKVLCAHRRGPEGVAVWNATIEGWIHDVPSYRRPEWYPGRPVMVTGNDYDLGVYNGDIGVVVRGADGNLRVVIDGRPDRPIEYRRLGDIQTVHAMTVHKSQGSQFDRVVVVLPSERSPVLTRELLYTAVTRAKSAVTIVGFRDVLADAIARPVSRASALPERLWAPND